MFEFLHFFFSYIFLKRLVFSRFLEPWAIFYMLTLSLVLLIVCIAVLSISWTAVSTLKNLMLLDVTHFIILPWLSFIKLWLASKYFKFLTSLNVNFPTRSPVACGI